MTRELLLATLLLATGCTEQTEQPAEVETTETTSPQQLEKDAMSIEQAADEAVKLIEAEAKAEADQTAAKAE